MSRFNILILILIVCFVPACLPVSKQYTELNPRILDATDAQFILVQVDHGEVVISESEDDRVKVGGRALSVDELEYQVSSVEKQIVIKIRSHRTNVRDMPLRVEVSIPKGRLVKVETGSASVFALNYQGSLEVASTSGDITIKQITGRITLRSNRGNITIQESSGIISMVGNYGTLNAQNVHGETAISTIMGNVAFDGLIQAGDVVRLETDHGAVSVDLSQDSSLSVQVRSTSGDVACMLPDIISTTRTCDGKIRSGDGNLSIRTVSGAVIMRLLP